MKKVLSVLLALCLLVSIVPLSASAEPVAEDADGYLGATVSFSYKADTGILTVTGAGRMDDFAHPESWGSEDKEPSPLAYLYGVKSIVIEGRPENNVNTIGDYAFTFTLNGDQPVTISIPDTVTHIGKYAFGMPGLTSISIPDSVEEIGEGAFTRCPNLETIELGENSHFTFDEESKALYTADGTKLLCVLPTTTVTTLEIPEGVTEICSEAVNLGDESSVTEVKLPSTLKVIDTYAFQNGKSITKMELPDGLTTIGENALSSLGLNELVIPDSVTSVGRFSHCFNIKKIVLPNGMTEIPSGMFAWSTVEEIVIPEGVTTIKLGVFDNGAFRNVTIPASVTSIENAAFGRNPMYNGAPRNIHYGGTQEQWNAIEAVDTSTQTDYYYDWTSWRDEIANSTIYCTDGTIYPEGKEPTPLEDFVIEDNVIIGYKGTGKNVVVPDGIVGIGTFAFHDSENLESVTLPDSVQSISTYAFAACRQLKTINIPEGVTSLDFVFMGCESLSEVYVPSTVTSMDYAFRHTALSAGSVPRGVTSLSGTFAECENLTSVTFYGVPTYFEDSYAYLDIDLQNIRGETSPFSGCTSLTDIYCLSATKADWNAIETTDIDEVLAGTTMGAELQDHTSVWEHLKNVTIHCEDGDIEPDSGEEPTPTPDATPTPTPDATPTPTPDATPTPTPVPNVGGFTDVKATAWYANSVVWAVEAGITSGKGSTTTFKPNDTCTRVEIMTFLWNSKDKPAPEKMATFSDMTKNTVFNNAISWAVESGITSGVGNNQFGTNARCTREQAVTFLWNAAGQPEPEKTATFVDMPDNKVFVKAISWAVENGITSGTGDNKFSPKKPCSRAEIVTFLFAAQD